MMTVGTSDRGPVSPHRRTRATTAQDPILALLARVPDERIAVEARARSLVVDARERGASWAQIGAALGISRQAAHERYG